MPKGQRLRQAIKIVIYNVYAFFEEQHKKSKACVPAKSSTKTARPRGIACVQSSVF